MNNHCRYLTLLSALFLTCSVTNASELIINGDFSQDLQQWPQSGSYTNDAGVVVVESGIGNDGGDKYLYLNFSESLNGAKGRFQRVDQALLPGSRLMISADFRTDTLNCINDIKATVGAFIRIQGWELPASENCADISIDSMPFHQQWWPVVRTRADSWTTAFTERGLSLEPDTACVVIRPMVLSCTGEAQFDNISVSILPPETLATGSLPTGDLRLNQYPKNVSPAGTFSAVGTTAYLDSRGADPRAEQLLDAALSAHGITQVSDKKDIGPETLVIRLADITAKGFRSYNNQFENGTTLAAGDPRREQGYVLEIKENGKGTSITIAGVGNAGQYYGVQTLDELLTPPGGMVWDGTIVDWPAYRYRGLVINTRSKLDLVAATKRNMVMQVGEGNWIDQDNDPNLVAYIEDCHARHVTCVFGDSPVSRVYSRGGSALFNYWANAQDVKDRFARLHDAGVRTFYLNFDDINAQRNGEQYELTFAEDISNYGTVGNAHYQYAAMIANLLTELDAVEGVQSTLLFTPMYYYAASDSYGVEGNAYLNLIKQLPENVEIVSTSAYSAQRNSQVSIDYQRVPVIWDNFIDRYTGYTGMQIPPADLEVMAGLENSSDYYLLPMGQPTEPWYNMAWQVTSDFLWNGDAYNPELSALRAMDGQ